MSNANEALNPPGLPVRSTAVSKSSPFTIGSSASSGFVISGGWGMSSGHPLKYLWGVPDPSPGRHAGIWSPDQTQLPGQGTGMDARGWGDASNLTLQGTLGKATSGGRFTNWESFGWICLDELEQSIGKSISLCMQA